MDKKLLIAIIASITTLLSPILTLYIKKNIDDNTEKKQSLQNEVIIGRWVGTTSQKLHNKDVEFKIDFLFKNENNKLTGLCTVNLSETKTVGLETFVINGGLYMKRFLRIEYNNNDPDMLQFGYFLLELSPLGKKLNGNFVGYGPESKEIICGKVVLEKQR
jgi:hypothetical protein